MKLKALLMCRNQQSLRLLKTVLDDFEIGQDCCCSAQEAIELVTRGNYSALVLDFDLPGAIQAARFARLTPPHRRPVTFAMLGASAEIESALQAGANFALYKPLSAEQVTHSVRAAYGFIRQDRRRSDRQAVETVVYLLFGKQAAIPTLMLDLSEEGLSVQAAAPLPTFDKVDVHFLLPGARRPIEGAAEVIWADDAGRAGLFFTDLPPSTQRYLKNWLVRRARKSQPLRPIRPVGSRLKTTLLTV
ncbi:MAG TPA: PilZ domain-containing protein [Terriglobales bacterium]|nr:PilZ domain-containing protein [Terriglobales bacterium]